MHMFVCELHISSPMHACVTLTMTYMQERVLDVVEEDGKGRKGDIDVVSLTQVRAGKAASNASYGGVL